MSDHEVTVETKTVYCILVKCRKLSFAMNRIHERINS